MPIEHIVARFVIMFKFQTDSILYVTKSDILEYVKEF